MVLQTNQISYAMAQVSAKDPKATQFQPRLLQQGERAEGSTMLKEPSDTTSGAK